MLENKDLFDSWASEYEKKILGSDTFPFGGYIEMVNFIESSIPNNKHVLDIGIGSGLIASQLVQNKNARITGIDQSSKMLEIAKSRLPNADLILYDFNHFEKIEFPKISFDFVLMTFFIHHYTDTIKLEIIDFLFSSLGDNIKIIIGDIGFQNEQLFAEQKIAFGKSWDDSEFYFTLDKFSEQLSDKKYITSIQMIRPYSFVLQISKGM